MDKRASAPAENTSSTARAVSPAIEKPARPGRVIALLNQKGGAGKTTLATHLAGEFALQGWEVTLLDADPQGSALDWAHRRLQSGEKRLYGVFGFARDVREMLR
jgi:chromosome partitioning protein